MLLDWVANSNDSSTLHDADMVTLLHADANAICRGPPPYRLPVSCPLFEREAKGAGKPHPFRQSVIEVLGDRDSLDTISFEIARHRPPDSLERLVGEGVDLIAAAFDDDQGTLTGRKQDSAQFVDAAAWTVLVKQPDAYFANCISESSQGILRSAFDVLLRRFVARQPTANQVDFHDDLLGFFGCLFNHYFILRLILPRSNR
jgi:hypothetical protein